MGFHHVEAMARDVPDQAHRRHGVYCKGDKHPDTNRDVRQHAAPPSIDDADYQQQPTHHRHESERRIHPTQRPQPEGRWRDGRHDVVAERAVVAADDILRSPPATAAVDEHVDDVATHLLPLHVGQARGLQVALDVGHCVEIHRIDAIFHLIIDLSQTAGCPAHDDAPLLCSDSFAPLPAPPTANRFRTAADSMPNSSRKPASSSSPCLVMA